MKAKAVLLYCWLLNACVSVLAQGSVPDMTKPNYAGRESSAWGHLLPPLLFFVGLALVAGMFLLGEAGRRRRGGPPPGAPPPHFPRRFPRPPFPPPPGPKP